MDASKLKIIAGAAFQIDLQNRFEAQSVYPDPYSGSEWMALKAAARETALKHLDQNRREREEWISGPTLA